MGLDGIRVVGGIEHLTVLKMIVANDHPVALTGALMAIICHMATIVS